MPVLSCTIAPEGVARFYDALICLAKFSETVGIEVCHNRLILTALNSSQSAFASLTLLNDDFFQSYSFRPNVVGNQKTDIEKARFTCQLYNRALLSAFRGRPIDSRDKDKSVEKCEVSIQDDPDKTECRLVIKLTCRHGVKKTYRLTYESVEIRHAAFRKEAVKSHWSIGAHILKSFGEYFGAKTEQLDMYNDGGRVTFTSYTEKVMNGKEILKQPLQTSITIDSLDFLDFAMEERMHIGISVKDFKSLVVHADTLKTTIAAAYSTPTQPMQLSYGERGMQCAFILMTIGEARKGSTTPVPTIVRTSSARSSVRPESAKPEPKLPSQRNMGEMPPPLYPASRNFIRDRSSQTDSRPSPPPPPASVPHESLFISADEDEGMWGENNYEEEGDQLGWGPSRDDVSSATSLHRGSMARLMPARPAPEAAEEDERRVPPTQRISEISGLFDD